MSLVTIAAYQFLRLQNLPVLREEIKKLCIALDFTGTVLLAPEGLNYFLCGEKERTDQFKNYLAKTFGFTKLSYKEHSVLQTPFVRLLVKIKKEIISMGEPSIDPEVSTAPYIEPKQLKEWLDQNKDIVLLDTRNIYEVQCGTFENAVHLNLDSFRQIVSATNQLPEQMKDKTIVMFCTGGIRCEKASAYFLKSGYKDVFQLQGGILNYFETCDNAHYQGNCFVFDWRLAVNSKLQAQPRTSNDPINAGRHLAKS